MVLVKFYKQYSQHDSLTKFTSLYCKSLYRFRPTNDLEIINSVIEFYSNHLLQETAHTLRDPRKIRYFPTLIGTSSKPFGRLKVTDDLN